MVSKITTSFSFLWFKLHERRKQMVLFKSVIDFSMLTSVFSNN